MTNASRWILLCVLLAGAVLVAVPCIAQDGSDSSSSGDDNTGTWIGVIAVIAGIIFIVWLCARSASQCPSCQQYWADETMGTRELGRTGGYQTITRQDVIKDSKGNEIGTTNRQEQVHVVRVLRESYHRCKFCGYGWATQHTPSIRASTRVEQITLECLYTSP